MKLITQQLLNKTSQKARESERKRQNYNFHEQEADLMQRMLNALEPGTYVRPHKHENPDKREVFIVLRGKLAFIIFDDKGKIKTINILKANGDEFGIEIEARVWHTMVSLEKGTVIYEIKDGPYNPENDKNFAEWSPKEFSDKAQKYLENLKKQIVDFGV